MKTLAFFADRHSGTEHEQQAGYPTQTAIPLRHTAHPADARSASSHLFTSTGHTDVKHMHFQEKYPITVAEIAKAETTWGSAEEIAAYFKDCIARTERVTYIAEFDHLAHTRAIGGEVAPGIQAAINVVFCFGHALPNPQVMAVRPRSIGITDMGDRFVISFMDAPMKPANDAMQAWTLALRNVSA